MLRLPSLLSAGLLLASVAAHAAGQRPAEDSVSVERRARAAQRAFESERWASLPETMASVGSSRCDAHVGSYCYWVDESDTIAPPEPSRVARARLALIARLDSMALMLPNDTWLTAARVRYKVEAGDARGAIAAAASCDDPAWCGALRGYALHQARRDAESNAAFDRALPALDAQTRCAWMDIAPLLDDSTARSYGRRDCPERTAIADRVLWAATPLFARGVGELRAEYLSRRVRTWIESQEPSPRRDPVNDALAELWVRYGWPRWFERALPPMGSVLSESVVEHDAAPSFALVPNDGARGDPTTERWSRWADPHERAGRLRYAPPGLHSLEPMTVQLARFRRGDSLLIVAAFDATRDSALSGQAATASLFVSRHPREEPVSTRRVTSGADVLALQVPNESAIVSVEAISASDSVAARWRSGIAPLPPAISDLLAFVSPDSPTGAPAFATAVDHAVRGDTISRDQSLGIYWEAYGDFASANGRRVSVSAVRSDAGRLRRALWRIHIGSPPQPTRVSWTEPAGREVAAGWIHFPAGSFAPGTYHVTIRLSTADHTVEASRRIAVR